MPLAMYDGKTKSLSDVLHVLNIVKNLFPVSQMVEQDLQVKFNLDGSFVKDLKNQCHLVTKGNKNGNMLT